MGYHPRIESKDKANFLTTRSLQSRLWFVNNEALEDKIDFLLKNERNYLIKIELLENNKENIDQNTQKNIEKVY